MKAYKICMVRKRRFLFFFQRRVYESPWVGKDLTVRYRMHRWATAPAGGLLCFGTFEEAYQWSRPFRNTVIFEVKAEEQVPLPAVRLIYPEDLDGVRSLWDGSLEPIAWERWPEGTLAFRRVKPIREVRHEGL